MLSDREYQVLIYLTRGDTVKQVADTLNLSINTVSTHRRRVMDKLSSTSNTDLIHHAIDNNLIER